MELSIFYVNSPSEKLTQMLSNPTKLGGVRSFSTTSASDGSNPNLSDNSEFDQSKAKRAKLSKLKKLTFKKNKGMRCVEFLYYNKKALVGKDLLLALYNSL
jgi:hypothetical protein